MCYYCTFVTQILFWSVYVCEDAAWVATFQIRTYIVFMHASWQLKHSHCRESIYTAVLSQLPHGHCGRKGDATPDPGSAAFAGVMPWRDIGVRCRMVCDGASAWGMRSPAMPVRAGFLSTSLVENCTVRPPIQNMACRYSISRWHPSQIQYTIVVFGCVLRSSF